METTSTTKLVFQGVKFYWRTRNTLDVTMVDHVLLQVIEVILFDPSLGMEAPRLYVSSSGLFSKLNHDDIELQQSFAMRNGVPITAKFIDGIMNKSGDLDDACIMCEKPNECIAFKTVHHQLLMSGVVDCAIEALEVEKSKLRTECDNVVMLSARVSPLNNNERWRIPIVFIKVANSKRLQAADAKIWRSVTQNMKTEDDAKNMAAVLDSGHSNVHFSTSCTTTTVSDSSHQPSSKLSSTTPFVAVTTHATTPATTPRQGGIVGVSRLYGDTTATRLRYQEHDSERSGREQKGHPQPPHSHHSVNGPAEAADQTSLKASKGAHHSAKNLHAEAGTTKAAASFNNNKKKCSEQAAVPSKRHPRAVTPKRNTKGNRVRKTSKPRFPAGSGAGAVDATTVVLSEEGVVTNAAQTAVDAAEDESEGFGTDDGSEDAVAQQGALQRMLAGFTSLRGSFFASMSASASGKYYKNTGSSAEGVPSTSGDGEESTTCDPYTISSAVTAATAETEGASLLLDVDSSSSASILVAASTSADTTAEIPATSLSKLVTTKQQPKPRSFLFAPLSLFASSGSASPSGCSPASATAGTKPSNDLHISSAKLQQKQQKSKKQQQSTAAFSVQKFFVGLVRWRASNKVFVEQ